MILSSSTFKISYFRSCERQILYVFESLRSFWPFYCNFRYQEVQWYCLCLEEVLLFVDFYLIPWEL